MCSKAYYRLNISSIPFFTAFPYDPVQITELLYLVNPKYKGNGRSNVRSDQYIVPDISLNF